MKDRKTYEEELIAKEAVREWATSTRKSRFILTELDNLGTQKKDLDVLRKEGKLSKKVCDRTEKELSNRIEDLVKVYEHVGSRARAMNSILLKLDPEDVTFLKYKYSKEMMSEEIARTLHISRATYFRYQRRIIHKVILLMKHEGWNFDV